MIISNVQLLTKTQCILRIHPPHLKLWSSIQSVPTFNRCLPFGNEAEAVWDSILSTVPLIFRFPNKLIANHSYISFQKSFSKINFDKWKRALYVHRAAANLIVEKMSSFILLSHWSAFVSCFFSFVYFHFHFISSSLPSLKLSLQPYFHFSHLAR